MSERRILSSSPHSGGGATIPYRPEIDGLRAVAVLAVILFHAGIPGFGGGFVGVDVFFVISGYLITAIISREISEGRFSLLGFYERRVRRILPALFFYAALAAALAIWLYSPHFLKQFGQSLAALAVLASNILFFLKTDYFNDFQETAPLLHTWSLAVEEQYYLIAPLLLMLFMRRSPGWALAAMAALAIASLVHAQMMLDYSASFSFYSVTSRFWELAVGGCLALAAHKWRLPAGNVAVSIVGLALIIWATVSYDALVPFPGLSAAVPVLGTALLIAFAHGENVASRVLGHRLLVGIGLVSYSWYLSHYVIFAVARSLGYELGPNITTLALIALSLALAIATYFLVEQPVRRSGASRKAVFAWALAAAAALGGLGLAIHMTDGLRSFKANQLAPDVRDTVLDVESAQQARLEIRREHLPTAGEAFDESARRKVLVLGDSLAVDFYVATQFGRFEQTQFRFLRMDDECMTGAFANAPSRRGCRGQWDRLLASSLIDDADEIILSANWSATTIERVAIFAAMLTERRTPVTILGPADFTHAASLSYNLARRNLSGAEAQRFMFRNIRSTRDAVFRDLLAELNRRDIAFRTIDKRDAFCAMAERRCALTRDGEWLLADTNHLTAEGYRHFAEQMRELGWYR